MSEEPLPALAAVVYEKDVDVNAVLRAAVERLRARGLMLGGVLQEAEPVAGQVCDRLHLVDIRGRAAAQITQDRGREAAGCRLDPRGLAAIAYCVDEAVNAGVDLVVVNKFGRAESEGAGLRSCLSHAVVAGVPVLTAVREPYVEAWRVFHGGLGHELPPDIAAITAWAEAVRRSAQPTR